MPIKASKGEAIDIQRVGRELGVRYVLEGAVRKAGNTGRISAQLIDAATGAHLWADRFDGLLEDIFELQDKVAASVAGVIEPTLEMAEIRPALQRAWKKVEEGMVGFVNVKTDYRARATTVRFSSRET